MLDIFYIHIEKETIGHHYKLLFKNKKLKYNILIP